MNQSFYKLIMNCLLFDVSVKNLNLFGESELLGLKPASLFNFGTTKEVSEMGMTDSFYYQTR